MDDITPAPMAPIAIPSFPSSSSNLFSPPVFIPSRRKPSTISSIALSTSSSSGMDGVAGSSLSPLHDCKPLHQVRHAQGIHNVEGEHNYQAYLSPALFDARLSPLGWA